MDVPAYLQTYLTLAATLPQRLDPCDGEDVAYLQACLRDLVRLVAARDATIAHLTRAQEVR